ncbi:uncharacterized protein LOC119999563 isoform X1 [Tripterygium wilfordii]|uniref:uncharacterized protein LOC119999563 isoform X1 n=1 Tax=Tripterygium wilfordii TaxID=458696 RepID=UPI0018F85CBA|nr:uncharacterized protein LOC119999563 isoform X1 [Tripterygium wilfordii]
MATIAATAARRAASLARISSSATPAQPATLIPRRGFAGAADHHGPPKINCWQDPMSPSQWKEEHFCLTFQSGRGNARTPYPPCPSHWKSGNTSSGGHRNPKFVIVSLSGWGLLFYGGYKFFTGGKDKKEEKLVEAAN